MILYAIPFGCLLVVLLALLARALTSDEERLDASRFCVALVVFLLIAGATLGLDVAVRKDYYRRFGEMKIQSVFDEKRDLVVIALGVSREDGEHITGAQKDAAMNAAKAVLELVGAEVDANSSAILNEVEAEQWKVDVDVSISAN